MSVGRISHRSLAGFTLLELLVVLIIIAVATAVAAPRLSGTLETLYARNGLRSAAGLMRLARAEAVFRHTTMAVVVDPEENRLVLTSEQKEAEEGGTFPGEESEASPEPPPEEGSPDTKTAKRPFVPRTLQLPASLRITGVEGKGVVEEEGTYRILFYPLGTASGGSLKIERSGGKTCLIRIHPLNGKVRVFDADEES